jgi:hypothetical protein
VSIPLWLRCLQVGIALLVGATASSGVAAFIAGGCAFVAIDVAYRAGKSEAGDT